MDAVNHPAENHMTSAAAFVEGGVQDTCDDTCSICLEAFCSIDPSTVTNCKHEFHLQCILEWCQRSSNCPMCWQALGLKNPDSQELLEGVERDRAVRLTPPRNATIFHHPTLGDFELPVGINDPDLGDRIMQHLAAAAAMDRTNRIARREGSRSRSSAYSRPQFVVFSSNPNASSTNPSGLESESSLTTITNPSPLHTPASSSGSLVTPTTSYNRSYTSVSSSPNLDTAGPSESFSDTWKTRLNSMSMKYKDSISKNTRGWTEKLFSRSSSMADIGSEVRREVNAGIAIVSRMMERLETRDHDDRSGQTPPTNNDVGSSGLVNHGNRDSALNEAPSNGNSSAPFATSSI